MDSTPLRAAYVGATLSTLLVLLSGQPAYAHVDVRPGVVERGVVTELRVELPLLREGAPPERLVVEGNGIELLSARLQGRVGPETRWSVRLVAAAPPGRLPVVLRAVFPDGETVDVDYALTVVPRAGDAGLPAGGLALAVLLAVGAAALFLRAARRKP
jgi:hypothetical protein